MKSLYESILSGTSTVLKQQKKIISAERKQQIIDFISKNYKLGFHNHYKGVKISSNIKINKDFTVDIKNNKYELIPLVKQGDTEIPTNELFTWGYVPNMWVEDKTEGRITNLKGFPKKCDTLWLICAELNSLEGAPEEIGEFLIDHNNKIKNLKGLEKTKITKSMHAYLHELESFEGVSPEIYELLISHAKVKNLKGLENVKGLSTLELYDMDELVSLEGLPKISNKLYCSDCPNLEKFVPGEIFHVAICRCPKVTQEEYDKIKHFNDSYSFLNKKH